MRKNLLYGLALLLITLLLYLAFYSQTYKPPPGFEPGKKAPDFNLETLDGRKVSLSQLKGKVVLINFWATWCPPCREEIPLFEEVYKKYRDKGFGILAISTDGSVDEVREFLKKFNVSFTVLMDDGKVSGLYAIQGLPTSFLVDREGKIFKIKLGKYRELERDLKEIL